MARKPPSLSREYEYGRIVSVDVIPLGDTLAADAASGASSITVEDAADFDENGGLLLLGGVVYTYTTWTEDETTGVGTITLSGTLSAAATEDTVVSVYDPLYATAASDKVAQVELVGDDGNVDTPEAQIALHLVDKLDEGVRGLNGEQVKLELEGDEWTIVDIFGLGSPDDSGQKFEADDTYVLTAADITAVTATVPLTFEPITESLVGVFGQLAQRPTNYTINYAAKTLTWPLSGWEQAGDRIWVHYAYRKGVLTPGMVDFQAAGWKYLLVDATDTTDRSAVAFNDSAWAISAAPFGDTLGVPYDYVVGINWPAPVTSFPNTSPLKALWLRRSVSCASGAEATVSVRRDDQAKVYWNGALIGTTSGSIAENSYTVPAASVQATNIVAVRVEDTGPSGAGNHTYGDVKVEQ